KKVSEAQRLADEKARAAEMAAASQRAAAVRNRAAAEAAKVAREATHASAAATTSDTPTAGTSGPTMRRKIALSGTRLDVTVERNGTVVREANAEVNLPNLLATVFTTTRRERKEVPFAFS